MGKPKDVILSAVWGKLKNDYDFDNSKLIGIGNYSKVYRVHRHKSAEDHALKILDIAVILRNPTISGKKEEVERIIEIFKRGIEFFKEFRDHPNILGYVDDGSILYESGGLLLEMPYMLSKYIEGDTLEKLLKEKKGNLPPAQIFNISEKILQAIVRIHEKNFYYWQIFPRKIIARESVNDHIPVYDPVLAYSALPEDPSMVTDLSGTNPGISRELIDTMSYFQNKEITQKEVEIASVNSTFGVLLYEMVTGDDKIRSTGKMLENLAGKLKNPGSGIELTNPLLINGVLQIIEKTIEKEPGKRYQNVKELLDALKDLKRKCMG